MQYDEFLLKLSVIAISSEIPCIDENYRFTLYPYKPCLIKYELDINAMNYQI